MKWAVQSPELRILSKLQSRPLVLIPTLVYDDRAKRDVWISSLKLAADDT